MASTTHIMAIDIGQTSTALWLAAADLSRSAYREVSGFRHRIETAPDGSCPDLAEAVEGAVASLLADLDCAPARVKAVWCSATGTPPDLPQRLSRVLPRAEIRVISDSEAAYLGTLWRAPGLTLIGGTGTVAFGRNGERRAVVGGWGYLFGDVGGGWGLARAAIMAAIAAWEGRGPETELAARLLEHFAVDSFRTLVGKVYSGELSRSQLGRAAPLVIELAEGGDAVATAIVDDAAAEYAGYIRAGATRLGLGRAVHVGYAGGVLSRAPVLRAAVDRCVQRHGITVTRWVPGSSLTGAARCALEAAGLAMTDHVLTAVLDATAGLKTQATGA